MSIVRLLTAILFVVGYAGFARGDDFDRTIAPLLAGRCLECHTGPKAEGGLDLSTKAGAMQGGDSGAAVVPGKPDESYLWERITADEMPPKHPLPEDERARIKKWIADGAPWGDDPIDPFRFSTNVRAGRDWWSLQPVKEVTPPDMGGSDWPRGGIDRFILRKLQEQGLTPSPQAEPRVLVRRLYVDLIGLPPPPEVVKKFAADPSDEAYAALVKKLLDSPHYGERWARHWLDIARFGESDGFERNAPRRNAWPYRDWVVEALNADIPYDQFAKMQLAGDVLPPEEGGGGLDGARAAGFLVAGIHNTTVGSSERMKRLAKQDELEELAATVGQTFLGLTMNCARCHDHKFDPITTEEYYSFIASLAGVNHGEREVNSQDASAEIARLDEQLRQWQAESAALHAKGRQAALDKRDQRPQETPKDLPQPIASWEFDSDLKDSRGQLHGTALGGARLEGGALVVDGRAAYVSTANLQRDLKAKTLEAWVQLDNLDQRGGAAISVQTPNGVNFDAIVFGEKEPRRWMAGSDFYRRTQSFQAVEEHEANDQPVHVAITYHADGTITGYRNGRPYGKPYKTGLATFKSGNAQVVFGLRHSPVSGGRMLAGRIFKANLYDHALSPEAVAASAGVRHTFVSQEAALAELTAQQRQRHAELAKEIAAAQTRRQKLSGSAKMKLYTVRGGNPGVMRVHVRGSVTDFGDEVPPAGVAALSGVSNDFGLTKTSPDRDRRRALANWITHPDNPLFARVMVNRVWHHHFGRGLVETPSDLGFSGGRPTHPELLDWLAAEFAASGYRLKTLHYEMVMSATYRQASQMNKAAFAKDAGNRWLWRASPRRVEAEVLRDSMLDIAGVLNREPGGPGFVDVQIKPINGTTYYHPLPESKPEFWRRTLYRFNPRGEPNTLLAALDCPDPSSATPNRSVTTTPLQALSLLNNSFVLQMSDAFAKRLKTDVGDDVDDQIDRAWQMIVARKPSEKEIAASRELIDQHGLPTFCRAMFNLSEFVVLE